MKNKLCLLLLGILLIFISTNVVNAATEGRVVYTSGVSSLNINTTVISINTSDYWDDMDSINTTQMENNNGVLNILVSWLVSLFYTKAEVDSNLSLYIPTSDLPLPNKTISHCSNITGATSNLCTLTGAGSEEDPVFSANFTNMQVDCLAGNYTYGVYGNGTLKCRGDISGGVGGADGNASSICSNNEVLLGDGSCYDLGYIQNSTNVTNHSIYIQLSDLTDQTFASANVRQAINLSTEDESYGLVHSTGVNNSQITIVTSGVYTIIAQPQVATGAGGAGKFHMWLEKYTTEWVNVSNSNVELVLGNNEENVIPLIATLKLNADEKIRLMGSVSDTNIKLDAQSPAGEPDIPSIIFSMFITGPTEFTDTDTTYTHLSNFTDDIGATETHNATYDAYALNVSTNWTQQAYDLWNAIWSASGGNESFNESHANTLYAGIEWDYNFTLGTFNIYGEWWYNQTQAIFTEPLLNATIDARSIGNLSWNETHSDTLYAGIEWDYNQTTPAISYADANMTVAVLQGILNTTEIYSGNCSVAGTCTSIAYLDYDNTGNLNLTGNANITGDLNVAGTSYLGDLIISAENITVDNLIPLSGGEVNITGNLTIRDKITFGLGEIIDNIIDGWIRITGNLQVNGDTNITGNLNISGTGTFGDDVDVDGNLAVYDEIFVSQGNSDAVGLVINYRGYLGGTTKYRNFWVGDGKNNNIMVVDGSDARVGIGDVAPETKLDVDGGNISFDNGQFFFDYNNDRVGIGTTLPTHKLNVVGDMNVTGNITIAHLDVDDIGSTTDEIDDVFIGTNQKIYLGDGQEASISYNGSGIIFEVA